MLTFCHLEMDFALGSFVNDILKKVFDDGHLLASFRGSVLRLISPPPPLLSDCYVLIAVMLPKLET